MAKRWRIRHKLLVGLGLVLGTIGLLLTGTVQGLSSYVTTMRLFDSKLAELDESEELLRATNDLLEPASDFAAGVDEEEARLRARLSQLRDKLASYERRLEDTLERGRDPEQGIHEKALIRNMQEGFGRFDRALDKSKQPTLVQDGESKTLARDPAVRTAADGLTRVAKEIRLAIYDNQYRRIDASKKQSNRSMALAITAAVVGVLITAGLLRFFYSWIFQPIHQLQEGVRRVATGNFEGKIELKSGDELEELADAFNEMTHRLHAKYTDLNEQVAERGKQLVRSERLASVGFLAAGVAHEINNPLASIAFCSEALERRLGDLLARLPKEQEAVAKYLKMIHQEAFRCKAITQNLLEFSRVGEGERTPADIVDIVTSVLEMAQHLKASEGKEVVFRPTAHLVAKVNPQEIKQVVLNMVVNAMESMDAGGTLTITLAPAADGSAELMFSDTGCGMPDDVLQNIFEPFFTRSRTGKGTGLGLSISQRIVTQHGGEIEASSPGPDHGSTFVVRLPLAPAVAAKEDAIVRVAA